MLDGEQIKKDPYIIADQDAGRIQDLLALDEGMRRCVNHPLIAEPT